MSKQQQRNGADFEQVHELLISAARIYGTPCYVYDAALVAAAYEKVKRAFPGCSIHYSFKANPNLAVCALLRSLGAKAEISSAGECQIAEVAGFAPDSIVFVGSGKSRAELDCIVRGQVRRVHSGSAHELEQLAAEAAAAHRRVTIAIWVNSSLQPSQSGEVMGGRLGGFGVDEELLLPLLRHIDSRWLEVDGIHVYAGSQALEVQWYGEHFLHSLEIARQVQNFLGRPLKYLNFGAPYTSKEPVFDLEGVAQAYQVAIHKSGAGFEAAELALELGYYLVAEAGTFLTRVLDVKESQGSWFAITDGEINHFLRPTYMWAQHPISVLTGHSLSSPHHKIVDRAGQQNQAKKGLLQVPQLALPCVSLLRNVLVSLSGRQPAFVKHVMKISTQPITHSMRHEVDIQVGGPLCTPLDTLGTISSSKILQPSDVIAVHKAGAYGYSKSMLQSLSYPSPAEIMILEGEPLLVGERSTVSSMLARQKLPQHLKLSVGAGSSLQLAAPLSKQEATTPTFITFIDVAYGVILGIALYYFLGAFKASSLSAGLLVILAYLLICDNWWGSHYVAVNHPFTETIFFLDIFDVLNFALLCQFASADSIYVLISLTAYALLGIVWNTSISRIANRDSSEKQVIALWTKSSLALAIIYLLFFFLARRCYNTLPLWLDEVIFGVWAVWRFLLAIFAKLITGRIV